MLRIASGYACNRLEDQFFALHLDAVGGVRAPEGVAHDFSVETMFDGTSCPVGVHAPHKHLAQSKLARLVELCPEAALLFNSTG